MRPLTLKFTGLRSYLAEQEINFTDVDLMAVVGDTGAGKSSLLEALCFALYGGCTWDARGGKRLIADGGDGTLRVELTFQARGKTWRVTRTTSASNYPPSTHRLEGLDDNSVLDNSRSVDDAIRKLIGLDYAAFLKAVVLPQGRFQELLQTREADRTAILKNVLGLDQIAEVRRHTNGLHDRLQPLLHEVELRRASLLPDPAATIVDAGERLSVAQEQVQKLDRLKEVIAKARNAHDDAEGRASDHRTAAQQLTAKIPEDIDEQYGRLIELDIQLTDDINAVDSQLDQADSDEADLKAVLATADAAGTGITGVATALATLESLLDQIPGIDDEQRDHAEERATIDAERAVLNDRRSGQAELIAQAELAQTNAGIAETAHTDATEKLEQCRALLTEARRAVKAASTASETVNTHREELNKRTNEVAEAQRVVAQADEDFDKATARLEAVHRANAAAHAASASHPGEPCPICVRPLPDDFTAPTTAETKQATTARTSAQKHAKTSATKLAEAKESRKTAQTNVDEAIKALDTALSERGEAYQAIFAVLGDVNLDQDDEAILTAVHEAVGQTATAKETAAAEAKTAHDAMTNEIADLRHAERALADREAALAKAQRALSRRQEKITKAHDTLPEPYRVHTELTTAAIDRSKEKAQQRQAELEDVTVQLDAAHKQIKLLRGEKERLGRQHRTTVEQPATQLSQRIQALADQSLAAAQLTGLPAAQERPTPSTIAEDAEWARDVLAAVEAINQHCLREASIQDGLAATAQSDAATALASADIADDDTLATLLTEARADARVAERDRDKAIAQQPLCAELDTRISAAKPMVDSLRELGSLLADGKFLAAVVKRRQRALLGIASELLQSMTKDRFAFSDDFRIVDGHTGQPRDVKTLSGGETFLASLALALALVELTSRGGGRVEALFLDEGFGSLDTNILGDALEALTRQADGGRLVAVISHMRDVAENFDNVLMVTRSLGGSQARWLTPSERDQVVTDELTAGLLT
ncbi:AAA family ATPase [Amycolatopsis palatopharyngis]|uniref:AAA family ATPase n=1 Tax=Amycolatopsis palatopharyngis TaxID=187982 RepID=UPI0013BEA8C4|nr:SMC family ATPase [Amycolatopsis palatopharyngis]